MAEGIIEIGLLLGTLHIENAVIVENQIYKTYLLLGIYDGGQDGIVEGSCEAFVVGSWVGEKKYLTTWMYNLSSIPT